MSESSNSDPSANPPSGEHADPASSLPEVPSPAVAPDDMLETPMMPAPAPASRPEPEPAKSEPRKPLSATRGTALVLTPYLDEPRAAPALEPTPQPAKSRFTVTPVAASVAAALLGAAIGSSATAGLSYLTAPPPAIQSDSAVTAALTRIDREVATLKSSVDGSARQGNSQIAKIAERLERAEKAQAETGAKLGRATEAIDRMEHRLAAAATPTVGGDITGSLAPGSLPQGPGERTATLADPKRPGPTVQSSVPEGWVLRDVFNGAAMLQSPRNGILAVLPGDTLPGLGRIEAIKRQDGHWVVVTSRGSIVSH